MTLSMTKKLMRPTTPTADDVVIWELRGKGSYRVTRSLFSGAGEMLPPKYCRTKKEADTAKSEAISHAKIKKVDVWIGAHDEETPYRWRSFRPQQ